MLTEKPEDIQQVVNALVEFHRNRKLSQQVPGVVADGDNLQVDYGVNLGITDIQYGTLEFARGQFELVRVKPMGQAWQSLRSYNHAGKNVTKQAYINALKAADLQANQAMVSALIILTSECCRSSVVLSAINALMSGAENFSDDVWNGLEFAFKNYKATALFRGYDIQAGGMPWTSLGTSDYLAYINSFQDPQIRSTNLAYSKAVSQYLLNASRAGLI